MAASILDGLLFSNAENPYSTAAQAIGRVNTYNPFGSSGSNALYGIGTGLASALLGAYGNSQTEKKNAQLTPLISAMVSGEQDAKTILNANPQFASKLAPLAMQMGISDAEASRKRQEAAAARAAKLEDSLMLAQAKHGLSKDLASYKAGLPRPESGLDRLAAAMTAQNRDKQDTTYGQMSKEDRTDYNNLIRSAKTLGALSYEYNQIANSPEYQALQSKPVQALKFYAAKQFGLGSKEFETDAKFLSVLSDRIKEVSGTAASEPEVARIISQLQGGSFVDPATIANTLAEVSGRAQNQAATMRLRYENPAFDQALLSASPETAYALSRGAPSAYNAESGIVKMRRPDGSLVNVKVGP